MSGRVLAGALLLAALLACGVKAPPRAAGAPDKAPPNDLFRPAEDPDRHRPLDLQPVEPPAGEPAR